MNVCKKKSCTRPQSPRVRRRRHMWVSQPQNSRLDGATTRCQASTKRSACNDTELSKYLWELKEKNEELTVSWKILAKARAYSNLSKRCNLCIEEKYFIITNPQMATLNKRNELVSTCRHRRNYILKYN